MSNKLIKLFGLPRTTEKLGLFRLRLCEIFSPGVFWALKLGKCILHLKQEALWLYRWAFYTTGHPV